MASLRGKSRRSDRMLGRGRGSRPSSTRRVLQAAFPMSARTFGTEPRGGALVTMSVVGAVAAVLVVWYALFGSNCSTEVAPLVANPRTNCIPRTISSDLAATIIPADPVTFATCSRQQEQDLRQQQLFYALFLQYPYDRAASTRAAELCASANASRSATVLPSNTITDKTASGVRWRVLTRFPDGARFTYPFDLSDDLTSAEFTHMCSGPDWSFFSVESPTVARSVFVLFATDITVSFLEPSASDVTAAYTSFISTPLRSSTIAFNMSGTVASVPGSDSTDIKADAVEYVVDFTPRFATLVSGPCADSGGAANCYGVSAFRFGGVRLRCLNRSSMALPAANHSDFAALQELLDDANHFWVREPFEVAPCEKHVALTIDQGVVPFYCPTQLCDPVYVRFADALALAIGGFGAMSFLVRALPVCHRRTLRAHWIKALMPLEASSIGKRPTIVGVTLVVLVQVVVCAVGMWYVLLGSSCSTTFVLTGVSDTAVCVPHALEIAEAQLVYRELNDDASQVISESTADGWLDQCADPKAGTLAAMDVSYPLLVQTNVSDLTNELCVHAKQTNVPINRTNLEDGSEAGRGVRISWAVPTSGEVVTFQSDDMEHISPTAQIRYTCGTDLWLIIEVADVVTRVIMLTLGRPFASTELMLSQADLSNKLFFDPGFFGTAQERVARLDASVIRLSAPLKAVGKIQAILPSSDPGRNIILLNIEIGGRSEPTASVPYCRSDGSCEAIGIHQTTAGVKIDVNLTVITTDVTRLQRMSTALESLSSGAFIKNASDTCVDYLVPMSRGGGKVRAWCRAEVCDSMTLRLATASSVGFAVLAASMFLIRMAPCLHRWDGRTETKRLLSPLFALFPASGTPLNHRPKRSVAVFLVLFQFAAIGLAGWWAFTQERCFSGFDSRTKQPRIGCARPRDLTTGELQTLFGPGASSSNDWIDVRASGGMGSAATGSFAGFLTVETIGELADRTKETNLLVQRWCSAFGDPQVTVTLDDERTQWTSRFVSNDSEIATWSAPDLRLKTKTGNTSIQACANADMAVWQHAPTFAVFMFRSLGVRNVLLSTDAMVTQLMALVETVDTDALYNVSLSGVSINNPQTVQISDAATAGAGMKISFSPVALEVSPRVRGASFLNGGGGSADMWGIELEVGGLTAPSNVALLTQALQGMKVAVLRPNVSEVGSAALLIAPTIRSSESVSLNCIADACDSLLSRAATAAAFAIAAVALTVLAVRKSADAHVLLPPQDMRKSISLAPDWGVPHSSSMPAHDGGGGDDDDGDGEEEEAAVELQPTAV